MSLKNCLHKFYRSSYKVLLRRSYQNQSKFRKGCECVDMIFFASQLVKQIRKHNDSLSVLFVDLKKAYDSVPRNTLCMPCVREAWCARKLVGKRNCKVKVCEMKVTESQFDDDVAAYVTTCEQQESSKIV